MNDNVAAHGIDLFVSYSTEDDKPTGPAKKGWIGSLLDALSGVSRVYLERDLTCFYAPDRIQAGQDWEMVLRKEIPGSRLFLACISPHYFNSKWCREEWELYIEQEPSRGLSGEDGGILPIYFVTVPGFREKELAGVLPEWVKDLRRRNIIKLLEFEEHGLAALGLPSLTGNLQKLGGDIAKRLEVISHAALKNGVIDGKTGNFVGRLEELRKLREALVKGHAGIVTTVTAWGGIGKTALAAEYAWRYRAHYSGGSWLLKAEGQEKFLPMLATLQAELKLPVDQNESAERTGERVLDELEKRTLSGPVLKGDTPACLLVADNLDNPLAISPGELKILTNRPWVHLLVTTRLVKADLFDHESGRDFLELDALPENEALELFTKICPRSAGDPYALKIIQEVDRHTLAVEVAARHLRIHEADTCEFIYNRIRRQGAVVPITPMDEEAHRQKAIQHQGSITALLDFMLERLAVESPAAREMLNFAALLPPESVPLPWLRELAGQRFPELLGPAPADGPHPFDEARLRLTGGWRMLSATAEPNVWRIHRLIAAHVAATVGTETTDALDAFVERRANLFHDVQSGRQLWELDALAEALPHCLTARPTRDLALSGLDLSEEVKNYRSLASAALLLDPCHVIIERLAESDPGNAGWQRDLLVSLNKLGDLCVAQGDVPGASRRYEESLAIAERLAKSDPGNAGWQRDLSVSLNKLGNLCVAQGDLSGGSQRFEQSLAIRERLAKSDPGNAGWQRDLSVSLNKLGDLCVAQGDLSGASGYFEEDLAIAERLAKSDPGNAEWQRDLSVSLNKLGDLCVAQGDLSGGSQRFEHSLAIAERLAKSDPGNAEWQRDLSVSLEKLGNLCVAQGDLSGGSQRFEQNLAIAERLAKSDPGNAGWQRDLSVSLEKLGDLCVAQGDLSGASQRFEQSLAIRERLAKSDPGNAEWQRDLSVSLNKLGDLCVAQGDLSGGSQRFEQSLAIAERLAKSDPGNAGWQRDLSVSLNKLGDLCVAQGDLSGGSQRFEESLAIFERLAKSDPGNAGWQRDVWVSYWRMASLAEQQNKPKEASDWWRRAYETLSAMKRRGLYISPDDEGFLSRLERMIG